jgi:hypothetical protein
MCVPQLASSRLGSSVDGPRGDKYEAAYVDPEAFLFPGFDEMIRFASFLLIDSTAFNASSGLSG